MEATRVLEITSHEKFIVVFEALEVVHGALECGRRWYLFVAHPFCLLELRRLTFGARVDV
jgi:hypothetical protein